MSELKPACDFITVATLSEFMNTDRKALIIHNIPILLFQKDNVFYAVHNLCTHENLPLTTGILEEDTLVCPFHGATFCIKTGAATAPAFMDLDTYPVRVVADHIQIAVPL